MCTLAELNTQLCESGIGKIGNQIQLLRLIAQMLCNQINAVKIYRALLTQSGTNAPTAIVLENTLGGTPTFTRDDEGSYIVTLAGAFPENKTAVIGCARTGGGLTVQVNAGTPPDSFFFNTGVDDALDDNFFQILVYP